jgi:lipoate-protein ligase A
MSATGDMEIVVVPDVLSAAAAMVRQQTIVEQNFAGFSPATILIWRSQRALIVTRQDTLLPAFDEASKTLHAEGWPVLVRTSGGGAFPVSPGTVQAAIVTRAPETGHSLDDSYRELADPIVEALADFGIAAEIGEALHAFCRGRHDILSGGRKLGGMAQHWRTAGNANFCTYAGASVVADEDPRELSDVVNRFYVIAGGGFRCSSNAVTSLRHELGMQTSKGLAAELLQRIAAAFQDRLARAA